MTLSTFQTVNGRRLTSADETVTGDMFSVRDALQEETVFGFGSDLQIR